MAPSTRQTSGSNAMAEIRQTLAAMNSIITALSIPTTQVVNHGTRRQANQFGRLAKVEFPKFHRDDVKGWVFKCEQFLLIDNTPPEEKKFVPGHKREGQLLSLVVLPMKELEEKFEDAQEELDKLENEELPQISLNAFNSASSFQTMRVVGIIANKYKLYILVDSGCAYNFLDINVTRRMGCKIIPISPVSITMAGGNQLVSVSECKGFTWQLKGETFVTDVLLLLLGGCEMVLGIQWLATLCDIKCNFKALRMEFVHNNKKLVIKVPQQRSALKTFDRTIPITESIQSVNNKHLLTLKTAIEARVKELCKAEEKEQSALWHAEMFTSYLSACSLGCTLDIQQLFHWVHDL
ncbi:reverse transcriptase [Tanacetum coccineum]|uniref:Reverse transcriptase n=1 Tax=Tanacetum coccineum TaxID=301880 RepID=A0ABQ4XIP9_9ASTR